MRRGHWQGACVPTPPATFARGVAWSPPLPPLLLRRLARAGFTTGRAAPAGPWLQWHGDLLAGGRGELLHLVHPD